MKRRIRHAQWFLGLVTICAMSHSSTARAGNDTAAAQALFEEARTLMAKGDLAAACAKFEGSEALDPGAGTEYNLALCYEKAGRSASAWATYLTAAASYRATNRAEWETKARDRASALAPTLSRVTLVAATSTPADVVITRDGAKVLPSELGASIPLDPGHHVIEATASGRSKWTNAFDLAPRSSVTIEIAFGPQNAGAPDATTKIDDPHPASPKSDTKAQRSTLRTVAYVAGGVGIVGLGLGASAGFAAVSSNNASKKACPNSGPCADAHARGDNSTARDWAAVSTVSFIAGGALLTGAAIMFFVSPKSSSTAGVYITPTIGLGGAGVTGAF